MNVYEYAECQPIRRLFHDCGYIYLSNIEPERGEAITVRLRAEKGNVTWAYVEISHDGKDWSAYEMTCEKEDETGYFEYFIGTIPGQDEMFKYRFRVGNEKPENEVYYSRTRIGKDAPVFDETNTDEPDDCWTIIPGFHTPDWAKGILWYSILPDAFYNGDITSDESASGENYAVSWNNRQHSLQYKYGGDLLGIEKKLDYIKELGCEAVFMNPIFKAEQNAGYGPEFYDQIENSFGNSQALVSLANAVHERGMYYMIDVVLTFVAMRDIWYNGKGTNPYPGAAQEWDSPWHDFFYFNGEEGDTKSYVADWGGVALNFASEKLRNMVYRDKDSYLQYYCSEPFCPDAIRFDCGGAIRGKYSDGRPLENAEIMGDMRSYLRAINPDLMLLSEYSRYNVVDKGVWDARWNLEFVNYGFPYMRGEKPESYLFDRYDKEIRNVPRTFALCQYNSMADHDRPRVKDVEPYAYRAFQLIHMTQIGSPCIFYGDENGIEREDAAFRASFYAMEWDESNWNYRVLNETKALIELRKRYSALRTGIIQYLSVDDENHILAYARKDESSTVVTIASRNPMQREFAVDTRELGELDGTEFTDWLTGRTYVAQDGYLDVVLPAGGTILVKGTASASYKGGFAITEYEENAADVTLSEDGAVCMQGKGVFANRDFFNTGEISAVCKCDLGTGMLAIGGAESDSAFIGAAVHKNQITVYVRQSAGDAVEKVACKEIAANSYVKIVRDRDNTFTIYTTRVPGSLWDEVVRDIYVELPNHGKAGLTVLDGECVFGDVRIEYQKKGVLWDDFTGKTSAMFDFKPDRKPEYRENGLVICPKDGDEELLTNAPDEDWTLKTEIAFCGKKEGDYAGLVSKQDDDICVTAGRMCLKGRPVFFIGRACAGQLVIYHTVEDQRAQESAVIQLQRIGTTYTAVYSYDGSNWNAIGKDVIANLCVERAGLTVHGETEAKFSYVSFGDAITDGDSVNTPHTPEMPALDFAGMKDVVLDPAYRIISGQWEYAHEGYCQRSKEQAQMGVWNKVYTDFKIFATYAIDEGTGFVGFEFGKKACDTPLGDGILFYLTQDGKVGLKKNGNVLAEEQLALGHGEEVKLAVENRHGVLAVYAGQESKPLFVLYDFEPTSGYLAYFTEGVVGHVNNSMTASFGAKYYFSADYEKLDFADETAETHWTHNHCALSPMGVGVTDFELSAEFEVKEFGKSDAWFGYYICASTGKFRNVPTVLVDSENRLLLKNGEQVLASTELPERTETIKLCVVKKKDTVMVFVNDSEEAALTYNGFRFAGGTISLVANHAAVVFGKPELREL